MDATRTKVTLSASGQSQPVLPIVATKEGLLRGALVDGVFVFKGVRYGATTAGYRFMPPRPPAAWEGVWDALEYGERSPQVARSRSGLYASWLHEGPVGEDCLCLNIFTDGLDPDARRPVMFYLHGGGFTSGSGSSIAYDGTRLAKKHGVVVVTINHRLAHMGYLYLGHLDPDLADSGNVGNLDIVRALEWVRDNIAAFGGDPGNVLAFGQSGGGIKVSCLMAMPGAAGLFHKAIVQSGPGVVVATKERAIADTATVLDALNLGPDGIDKLRTMPHGELTAMLTNVRPPIVYGPLVDGRSLPRQMFDPDAPQISRDVPLMVGNGRDETTSLLGGYDEALFSLTWDTLPDRLAKKDGRDDYSMIKDLDPHGAIAAIRADFPNASPSEVFFIATLEAKFGALGRIEAERKAALAAKGGAPAFMYYIEWPSPVDGGKWRTSHSLDLAFIFDNVEKAPSMVGPPTAQTAAMARAMSGAWVRFAKTGTPGWPPYEANKRTTMVFNTVSATKDDPNPAVREYFAAEQITKMGLPI